VVGLIVHEWISEHGGAENVLDQLTQAFPDADIKVLWNDAPGRFPEHDVTESWIARTPLRGRKALALPLMSSTWRNVDVRPYDYVVASSHLFAHHVGGAVGSGTPVFAYVHTPARMIWAPEQDPRGRGLLPRASAPALRRLDRRRVNQDASFVANSNYIGERIRASWGQEAKVIYPPVEAGQPSNIAALGPAESAIASALPREFILGASRFVEYKRLDLVIETARLVGLPLVLAGDGPLYDDLESRASALDVRAVVVRNPTSELLDVLYRRAAVFVFPPVEDFGIMPIEAMSKGTPVVVNAVGGARESVELTGGGAVSSSQDPIALAQATKRALNIDMSSIPHRVLRLFSAERFRQEVKEWVLSE